jgi:hypothetical protein
MEPRDEVARAAFIEKGDLLPEHRAKHIPPEGGYHPLTDDAEKVSAEVKARSLESEEADEESADTGLILPQKIGIRSIDEAPNYLG